MLVELKEQELLKNFKCWLAIVDKRRPKPGQSQVMNIVGDVKGKTCIVVDDIIDSGGTIVNAAKALKIEVLKKFMFILPMEY